MSTAKVFQIGKSQAIRIPKEYKTEIKEFLVSKIGEGFLFFPADDPWFPLKLSIGKMPDDFMTEREQPSLNEVLERVKF